MYGYIILDVNKRLFKNRLFNILLQLRQIKPNVRVCQHEYEYLDL